MIWYQLDLQKARPDAKTRVLTFEPSYTFRRRSVRAVRELEKVGYKKGHRVLLCHSSAQPRRRDVP